MSSHVFLVPRDFGDQQNSLGMSFFGSDNFLGPPKYAWGPPKQLLGTKMTPFAVWGPKKHSLGTKKHQSSSHSLRGRVSSWTGLRRGQRRVHPRWSDMTFLKCLLSAMSWFIWFKSGVYTVKISRTQPRVNNNVQWLSSPHFYLDVVEHAFIACSQESNM